MRIRTTVTLDKDVMERVKQESRARGASFRETLNELLRTALPSKPARTRRAAFRVRPHHMGPRPGLPYDDIAALIEYGEGPAHR